MTSPRDPDSIVLLSPDDGTVATVLHLAIARGVGRLSDFHEDRLASDVSGPIIKLLEPRPPQVEDASDRGGFGRASEEQIAHLLTGLGGPGELELEVLGAKRRDLEGLYTGKGERAVDEPAADILITVDADCFVFKGPIFVSHMSVPVVGCETTVAQAGRASSLPGGGLTL